MKHIQSKSRCKKSNSMPLGGSCLRAADWYSLINGSNIGSNVSQETIIECAISQLATETQEAKEYIKNKIKSDWKRFVDNNSMQLTKKELLRCGIIEYLMKLVSRYNSRKQSSSIQHTSTLRKPLYRAPSLAEDPNAWFDHYDIDGTTSLSKDQVFQAILDSLLTSKASGKEVSIRSRLDELWGTFDTDSFGLISKWTFLTKGGGLASTLISLASDEDEEQAPTKQKIEESTHLYQPPPSLSADPIAWFEYFDCDESGRLSQKQLMCALFATFNAVSKDRQALVKSFIRLNWGKFDINFDGYITKAEFLKSEDDLSLAEMLVDLELDLGIASCHYSQDANRDAIEVNVKIPNGMKSYNLIQIVSPTTKELVMLSIPPRNQWSGGLHEGDPNYFTVQF